MEERDFDDELQLTDLEKQFRATLLGADKLISDKEDIAIKALREAVALSEEHGIPYGFSISFLRNRYTPRSFNDKWSELDEEFLEYNDVYSYSYAGWQHSAVC